MREIQSLCVWPVEVNSDHKPLVPVTKKPLIKCPPKLQRLLLRLQKYDISITYVPGKYMDVPDTLSRGSLNEKSVDSELNDDMEVVVHKSSTDRREARTNEICDSSR